MADKKLSAIATKVDPLAATDRVYVFDADNAGVDSYCTPVEVLAYVVSAGVGVSIQAYDAGLASLAGLTYVSDSFIKVTAEDTYAIRTIAETKTDLSLNNVENTAISTWAGSTNLTTLGTDAIDAITEIATALKTGSDAKLVTGTAGTSGYLAQWNADGDLVDGVSITAPQFTTIELGHASDTTISRVGAADVQVEGVSVVLHTMAKALNANNKSIYGNLAEIDTRTTATEAITDSDNGKVLVFTSGSAVTVTVATGISVGFNCMWVQKGAGQLTFAATGGNVRNKSSHTKSSGQYAMGTLFVESNGGSAPELYLGGDTGT